MSSTNEEGSEVARLLARINAECEAAQRGLNGFASTARHEFITARMENIGRIHSELQSIVGDQEAIALVADRLNTIL